MKCAGFECSNETLVGRLRQHVLIVDAVRVVLVHQRAESESVLPGGSKVGYLHLGITSTGLLAPLEERVDTGLLLTFLIVAHAARRGA